jgi:sulfhydrogenase subunit alpha
MSRTITVNHLARIEGHGGITVVLDGDEIQRVEMNVLEGIRVFEGLVRGRSIVDVPGIVSRICAICSHGHAITSLRAIERALAVRVSTQTERLRELAFHGGAIESHALHVFCLALPDFLGHASVVDVASVNPGAVAMALRLKKLGNTIQEVVGGRAVHPVNYVIGGFGRLPSRDDLLRVQADLAAGLADCERALDMLRTVEIPEFAHEPIRCAALVPDGDSYFFGSVVRLSDNGSVPVDDYRTLTNERVVPHAHAKQSLCDGRPYMVGALARLTLNGSLVGGRAREAWSALGPAMPCRNVVMNNVAQVIELVLSVERSIDIVNALLAGGLDTAPPAEYRVRAGRGAAASEVPRGTLFHHYDIDASGRIAAADVVTPTAQNFAHVEDQFRATIRGAAGAGDDDLRHRLEIVARAYDPCVSCSVHVMRVGSS